MNIGDKVGVPGLGYGTIIAFHGGCMADVKMDTGNLVVRKSEASLLPGDDDAEPRVSQRNNPALTSDELREIAGIIRKQVGAKSLMWLGAHDFMYGMLADAGGKQHPGIQFSVKGTKVKVGGRVRVLYDTGADTYIVFVFRVRKYEAITVKQVDDVYGEQLASVIERIVG